jgi:hypothetical protein
MHARAAAAVDVGWALPVTFQGDIPELSFAVRYVSVFFFFFLLYGWFLHTASYLVICFTPACAFHSSFARSLTSFSH